MSEIPSPPCNSFTDFGRQLQSEMSTAISKICRDIASEEGDRNAYYGTLREFHAVNSKITMLITNGLYSEAEEAMAQSEHIIQQVQFKIFDQVQTCVHIASFTYSYEIYLIWDHFFHGCDFYANSIFMYFKVQYNFWV